MADGDTPAHTGGGPREVTIRTALTSALHRLLAEDERVLVFGEDVRDPMGGSYKVTLGLSTEFGPDRVRNTPISESAIVGTAVGASMCGYRPICEVMYFDFFTTAMDQVVNQAAFMRFMSGGQLALPMVIRCTGGAGRSSAAQHSKSLEAWFAHVPGLKVWMPSTPQDAYWMLLAAVEDPNPVIFFEHGSLYSRKGALDTGTRPDLAGPRVVHEGEDVLVVTWGIEARQAEQAAAELAAEGIGCQVLDLRRLAPLELTDVIDAARRIGRVIVMHEAWGPFGPGAEVAFGIHEAAHADLAVPVQRVAAAHIPHPFDPRREAEMLPNVARLVEAVRTILP